MGEALSLHGGSCLVKKGVCAVEISTLRLDVDRFASFPVVYILKNETYLVSP